MEDVKWLAIVLGLTLLSLLYIRLLGDPGTGSGSGAGEEAGS
jgi:hypothetical protein